MSSHPMELNEYLIAIIFQSSTRNRALIGQPKITEAVCRLKLCEPYAIFAPQMARCLHDLFRGVVFKEAREIIDAIDVAPM
jgi:hypothetical protein